MAGFKEARRHNRI